MSERPILILTASAGAGHMTAARAVEEALRSAGADSPVEVVDVLDHTNAFFRRLYAQGYLSLVNHAPRAMGWLYEAMDRPNTRLRDAFRLHFQNLHAGRTMRLLAERRPRMIVNTHFLPAEIVAHLRRGGRLNCPQVTVTTDFETHRLWAQQPTERYYTATHEGKAYLATWGVPPDSILVTGIPVRAAFERGGERAEIRARLALPQDRPVVLMLSGGFGVGPSEQLFAELLRTPGEPHIAVIAGRNEALRRQLADLAHAHKNVTVGGFTDAMHDWMRAADVAVTKPGGLTVTEALVCGLPLVVVNPIPGQEARNSDYLLENGAAIKVNNLRLLAYRVGRLVADAPRLTELRAAAIRIARPGAAQRIAKDVLQLLNGGGEMDTSTSIVIPAVGTAAAR